MNDKQSSLTFFQPDRDILGWVTVLKRVMFVFTASSLMESNTNLTLLLLGLREGLSAYTEYATPKNPIATTQQSSPPTPTTDVDIPENSPAISKP